MPPRLALRGVSKSFGSTAALRGVDFDVRPSEVHVLAGENGAGKSTLIRILSGVHSDYAGSMELEGRPVRFRTPAAARAAGIATIHQELSLVPSMSIEDNLYLAHDARAWAPVRRATVRAAATRVLEAMQLDLSPRHAVGSLPMALRQLVEIARALAQNARCIVMDEPTSALSELEAERLLSRIESLKKLGTSVVYVSHRIEEIYRLADRISVLRDGRCVMTATAASLGAPALVRAMLGRTLEATLPAEPLSPSSDRVLRARDIALRAPAPSGRRVLDGVSVALRRGEIVGVAGLRGSGASELLHALFGSYGKLAGGAVRLLDQPYTPRAPAHAIDAGIVLLPNDRASSVFSSMSVLHNATLSSLRLRSGPWLRTADEARAVAPLATRLRMVLPSLDAPIGQLSGGNQQKVMLARCLLARPKLLLLDEPTRGIDVGAKADVHELIRELSAGGVAVLFVASDVEELLALAHRVVVLFRGRVVAELERQALSRERLVSATMGAASGAV